MAAASPDSLRLRRQSPAGESNDAGDNAWVATFVTKWVLSLCHRSHRPHASLSGTGPTPPVRNLEAAGVNRDHYVVKHSRRRPSSGFHCGKWRTEYGRSWRRLEELSTFPDGPLRLKLTVVFSGRSLYRGAVWSLMRRMAYCRKTPRPLGATIETDLAEHGFAPVSEAQWHCGPVAGACFELTGKAFERAANASKPRAAMVIQSRLIADSRRAPLLLQPTI